LVFKDHGSESAQHGGGSAGVATLTHFQILARREPRRLQRFSGFADRY
jgi:hypothetical protein